MLSLAMRDVPSARSPSLPQLVCRESAIMICERVCTGYLAGASRSSRTAADGRDSVGAGHVGVGHRDVEDVLIATDGREIGAGGLAATARGVRQLLGGWSEL
jgi:hypothetical protein